MRSKSDRQYEYFEDTIESMIELSQEMETIAINSREHLKQSDYKNLKALLKEFLTACDSKWGKTTPPKELVGVIEKVREYLNES